MAARPARLRPSALISLALPDLPAAQPSSASGFRRARGRSPRRPPSPAATRCGSFPMLDRRVTPHRSRVDPGQRPVELETTQTAPSPTRDVHRAVADREVVGRRRSAPGPESRSRVTVSSSKFATQSAPAPTAIAAGACPTVMSRSCWIVAGSTSMTEFAARFTIQSDSEPEGDVRELGENRVRRRQRPASRPTCAAPARPDVDAARGRPASQANHTAPPPTASARARRAAGDPLPESGNRRSPPGPAPD